MPRRRGHVRATWTTLVVSGFAPHVGWQEIRAVTAAEYVVMA
jgi:hypothetical protein